MVLKPATFFGEAPEVEIENRTRASLETSVAAALATSGGIDAADVHVTAKGATIVLSGIVATPGEIERAAVVAKAVAGVAAVVNQLIVG